MCLIILHPHLYVDHFVSLQVAPGVLDLGGEDVTATYSLTIPFLRLLKRVIESNGWFFSFLELVRAGLRVSYGVVYWTSNCSNTIIKN